MNEMNLRSKIITISAMVVLVALLLSFAVIAAGDNIYRGVSVAGVDVGGLSIDEAEARLSQAGFFDELPGFVCNGREFDISPTDISLVCEFRTTAQKAHACGRSTNIFTRLINIFGIMLKPVDITVVAEYDKEALGAELDKHIADLREPLVESSIRMEGDKLYITNGSQGVDVNKEKLNADIIAAASGKTDKIEVLIETINPTFISASRLHDEYFREVVDADYKISGMRIKYTESSEGVDFDVAEAEKIIEDNLSNTSEYYIPLIITEPEMTKEELEEELFGDCLGTYTSRYNPDETGRTKNVTIASRSINDIVLQSGDEFSYNAVLGERTKERGYVVAKVYAGGEVVDGIGGGICQVSSTLYNAVLYADLQIVSRTEHSLPVAYVPLGRDATVVYGSIDFKFKNQYDTPVKITSSVSDGHLTVSVYGKKTEDKKVEIYTENVSTQPYSEIVQSDDSIPAGATKVKQSGSDGAVVRTYKKVIKNGKVVSDEMIHTSQYTPIHKIILTSSKSEVHKEPESETPVPEESAPETPVLEVLVPEVTVPEVTVPEVTVPEEPSEEPSGESVPSARKYVPYTPSGESENGRRADIYVAE